MRDDILSSSDLTEIEILCKSRQKVYSFLARIFEKEMTDDSIKALQRDSAGLSGMQALKELVNSKLNEGLALLDEYLEESRQRKLSDVRMELAIEYAGLFLSVWGKPAHPSESVYASGGAATMQRERDEVLEVYRTEGVDKVKDFTEPEDHIALELQFMSYLSGETAKSAAKGDWKEVLRRLEGQQTFLNKHLGKWIGLLANDVMSQGRVGFYKGACLIAEGLVDEDVKSLRELIEEMSSKGRSTA